MSPGALSSWAQHGREAPAFSIGNVIDFSFDDESRLSSVSRPAQPATTAFAYDGRSFLESADETQDGDGFSNPVYDSQGTLMSLEHNAGGGAASDRYEYFYLAGRPVAQLEIDGAGAETWTYLTTDHLGTPMLATDSSGNVTWEGGFEPFGTDYQAGTSSSALANHLFLRLPGQWDDGTWSDASLGAPLYYNLHRWYEYGTGRYTRPDPFLAVSRLRAYTYSRSRPTGAIDPQGLRITWVDPQLEPMLRCAIRGSRDFRRGVLPWFINSTTDWEIRVHPRDSSSLPPYCKNSSCWVRPNRGFGPSRVLIYPTHDCSTQMSDFMHEMNEIYANQALGLSSSALDAVQVNDPADPFQSPAHHYAKQHGPSMAKHACCHCSPQ